MRYCHREENMVEFITGASGTGKTTEMFERISKYSAGNCIALVPEQYSTEFDKKLYFHIGAEKFNNMLSLSFSSLARQLFQLYGEPDRKGEYADDMARLIITYQAIKEARNSPEQLLFFGKTSTRPGFAEEILKLIGDMKKSGVSPRKLMDKSGLLEKRLHDKVSDVANIFYEYEFLMEQYGYKDHLENIREAAKIAAINGFFKGKCVFLDEFESFTGDQLDMLEVIMSAAETTVITLRSDDVNAGPFTLFETVNNTYLDICRRCRDKNITTKVTKLEKSRRFASADLEYISERAMRNLPNEPENAPKPDNIRIFEARDMYSEAEYVCAELVRLIHSDKSLKFRDIAVISNNMEEYADVLKAAFARYDIPYFMSMEQPVVHTAVMAFFLSLLDLLTARQFRSEQIFRMLKCGLLEIELTDVSLLENYCYKWGIDGAMWTEEFSGADENLELLENLRSSIIVPIVMLRKKISRENTAENFCRMLYNYLVESNAEKCLGGLILSLIRNDHDNEAAELKRLWGCLMNIFDGAADTLGDSMLQFSEFADILRAMTTQISYSQPPGTLDAVTAASARTARLSSPRVIFVMGASDGDFPNQVSLHGLFTEGDKQKLAEHKLEIARPLTDLIASERLIVYKALTTASEKLYISYPLSDLSGQAKYPARIVEQVCEMFPADSGIMITESMLTPLFYAVTKKSAYYHYMQNRSDNTKETATLYETLLEDEEYRRRITVALSKTGQTPDFKIDREIMEKLENFNPLFLSPSSVDRYNRCHFMHFCEKLIRLKMPEKIELDRRITGELTHSCFQNILGKRTKSEFVTMSYDDLCAAIKNEAEAYRTEKMAGDFGKTPRFELFFNKLTERLGDIFRHTQYSLMAGDFVPDKFELDIRKGKSAELTYGSGKKLIFGGIIDRADVCTVGDEKYVRVVDYKSSKKHINEASLAGGVNLQMLMYLFAACEDGGVYEDYKAAGVLYTPLQLAGIAIDQAKIEEYNQAAVDSELKTTGLLIDKKDVLEKMEHGLGGKYIPVKVKKDGSFDRFSSVVSEKGMDKLRDYVYEHLTDAAESLLNGDISAIPLKTGNRVSCSYCNYADICGNGDGKLNRQPDAEKMTEAAKILGKETGDNGVD